MTLSEDILDNTNIVDTVEKYVDLKKAGRNYTGLCPFHSEKTPSFMVSEDKQIFKCFGCGVWGNAIKFIMEIERAEFFEAAKLLAKDAGVEIKEYKSSKDKWEFKSKEDLWQINKTALNFFHSEIFESKKALEYMEKDRKMSDLIIKKYKLWYAPDSYYKVTKYLKKKWYSDELIVKAGLGRKNQNWELSSFFHNRIIFPIFSQFGEPVAFSGRVFNNEKNTGKYINTPDTPLYDKSKILYNYHIAKQNIKEQNFVIVVEWFMDVIWLERLGYFTGVATCGTALTKQHSLLLKRLSDTIIFSFDNDEAGKKATIRWLKMCLAQDMYPRIFAMVWAKDFDDVANDGIEIDIEKESQDCVTYVLEKSMNWYPTLGPVEKSRRLNSLFEILVEIKNHVILWDYLWILGKNIWVDQNVLYNQLKGSKRPPRRKKEEEKEKDKRIDSDTLIAALFLNNFFQDYTKSISVEKNINTVLELLDYIKEDNIVRKTLIGEISKEEKDTIKEAQLWWEKTFANESDEELTESEKIRIADHIERDMKAWILWVIQTIIKNPKIGSEEKTEIMKKIR